MRNSTLGFVLLALLANVAVAVDAPVRLIDIVAGTGSSSPRSFTPVGNVCFFVADTPGNVGELWKTDGTTAGTVRVKNIRTDSMSAQTRFLTAVGNRLYFVATTALDGQELWTSDGTEAGTVLVKNIQPGPSNGSPELLTAHQGMLYFTASNGDAANGRELWKSDGTAAGTVMVKDIYPGGGGSSPAFITSAGTDLFFSATSPSAGVELWKSDGTDAGTILVQDIQAGTWQGTPQALFAANGKVFFNANDGVHGPELWSTDGTSAGTVMIKDINVGSGPSVPDSFIAIDGYVYFRAWSGGSQIWRTDGTNAGTTLVAALDPARISIVEIGSPGTVLPRRLQSFNGALYFITAANNQLYRSDGTPAGTIVMKTLGTAYGSDYVAEMSVANNSLYIIGNSTNFGRELWISDGTTDGTIPLEIRSGTASANALYLASLGSSVFFSATDGVSGFEPYRYQANRSPVLEIPSSGVASVFMSEDGAPIAFVPPSISASDPDGGPLTWTMASPPGHGSAECSGTGNAPGVLTYLPNLDWNGTDSFTVRATDPSGLMVDVLIEVTVQPINDPPVASSAPYSWGSPFYRSVLSFEEGVWNDNKDGGEPVTITYAWLRNGIPIDGQTSHSYVCQPIDVGTEIQGRMTVTDSGAPGSASTVVLTEAWNIGPYPLWYTGLAVANKVYDGTVIGTLAGTPTLQGYAPADDVAFDLTGVTVAFDTPEVGTGKSVNISGLALIGAQAHLYIVIPTSATVTADITPPTGLGEILLSSASLSITEAGTTTSLNVSLSRAPIDSVVVAFSVDQPNQAAVDPASLTFTPANWNVPQILTITAIDDAVDDGDLAVQIVGTATSADPGFQDVTRSIAITALDNDTAGIAISGLPTTIAEGAPALSIGISLATRPSGEVSVAPTETTPDLRADPTVLVFTPDNWSIEQSVNLWAPANSIQAGDVTAEVNLAVLSPDDAIYATLTHHPISLIIVDTTSLITFNSNGGIGTMPAQTKANGVDLILSPNTFTRAGYAFSGWNTAVDASGIGYSDGANYAANSDVILYAQWAVTNDAFANRFILNGHDGTTTGSTIGFTKETNEQRHAGQVGGSSAWWSWTAPFDGFLLVETAGSNFDTVLAIYATDSIPTRTPSVAALASNNNRSASDTTSRLVNVPVVAGTTYQIAVDGVAGAQGTVAMRWDLTPLNDRVSRRITLTGESGETFQTNIGATKEAGEADHAGSAAGRSVWWEWTAPRDGVLHLATAGSTSLDGGTLDTVMAVQRMEGTRAVAIAANDDTVTGEIHAELGIKVTSGTMYRIVVDGNRAAQVQEGEIHLSWWMNVQAAQ